jgi:hypothetical protein
MLEVLAHARIGKAPKHQVWVKVQVLEDMAIEHVSAGVLPEGWDARTAGRAALRRPVD